MRIRIVPDKRAKAMPPLLKMLNHRALPWFLLLLWVAPPTISRIVTGSWASAGTVGDAFGPTSSLFSGLALLGVILTLQGQYRDSERRDRQTLVDRRAMQEQTLQAALATQLQSARALISEHRKALVELNPAISEVPTAPSLLKRLREEIERDAKTKVVTPATADLLRYHIDELLALQSEISMIRNRLETLYESYKKDLE